MRESANQFLLAVESVALRAKVLLPLGSEAGHPALI
jgi:hypothetical protein